MSKYSIICLIVGIVVFHISCTKDNDSYIIQDTDHSGYGYMGGLYRNNAELMFIINSEKEQDVTLSIRCKCLLDFDANSCSLSVNGQKDYSISIPDVHKWVVVQIPAPLKQGENILQIKKDNLIKTDVLIDYIEFP